MKRKKHSLILAFLIFAFYMQSSMAQNAVLTDLEGIHICTMPDTGAPNNTLIKLRPQVKQRMENRVSSCANINVTYEGTEWTDIFGNPNEAQVAFQLAVDIWESFLDSPVTINVRAVFQPAANNANLGSASATYFREIDGDGENITYPAPLYEKLLGSSGNGFTGFDMTCNFNSGRSDWFFPTAVDQPTPAGQFNLTSVVLHEIGHGLGMAGFGGTRTGSTGSEVGFIRRLEGGGSGNLGDPNAIFYTPWDKFIETGSGNSVLSITDPSSFLLDAFTGDDLVCVSPIAVAQNAGVDPKTYAPSSFNGGSSYSHWDEATFNGTETALMTPFLGPGESVYDPGDVTLGFMEDMGWSLCQGSLSTNDFDTSEFQISPNPFTDKIEILLDPKIANDNFKARIIDINGKTIFEINTTTSNGKLIIDQLSNLPSSLYFLKLTSNTSKQSITKKVIKN